MLVKVSIPEWAKAIHPSNPVGELRIAALDIASRAETVKASPSGERVFIMGNDAYCDHLEACAYSVEEFPDRVMVSI